MVSDCSDFAQAFQTVLTPLAWMQEFDFSRFNKTRFAGLENGIANCYANALVQVFLFAANIHCILAAIHKLF